MNEKFRSRKFALATASLLIASTALFMGHISGGEWVAAVTLILGLYGTANVADKKYA